MRALIDGDVLVYNSAFAAQKTLYYYKGMQFDCMDDFKLWAEANNVNVKEAKQEESLTSQVHVFSKKEAAIILRNKLLDIRTLTGSDRPTIYLSGVGNFRDQIGVTRGYKANRFDAIRPVHYEYVRELLVSKYAAIVVNGEEADDAMGIAQTGASDTTCIASVDKDLNCIPGYHYDWNKQIRYQVGDKDALYFFMTQCLTGDTTDNIPGIPGMGEKKAAALLSPDRALPEAMWNTVIATYNSGPFKFRSGEEVGGGPSYLEEQMQLLWIRRKPNELITLETFFEDYIREHV